MQVFLSHLMLYNICSWIIKITYSCHTHFEGRYKAVRCSCTIFLTLVLHGGEWSVSSLGHSPPSTHFAWGRVCPRATLGVLKNRNISYFCQDFNPEPSSFSPVQCVFVSVFVTYLVTQSVVHYGPLTLNNHSISRKFVSGFYVLLTVHLVTNSC
jgi:hypothetical protein